MCVCVCVCVLLFYSKNSFISSSQKGTIYRGNQFPTQYRGAYFFADYSRNWLKYMPMKADGSGPSASPILFDNTTYGCIGMSFSPDGSLWLNSIYGLERIFTVGGNAPPIISKALGTPAAGPVPLTVSFQGLATDPEGAAVKYTWDFGDGTTSTQQNPTKVYSIQGRYNVFLRASDGNTTSTSSLIKIEAGNKPIVTIASPAPGQFFVAGEVLSLTGSAVQGGVPVTNNTAYSWNILLFHDDHTHPVATNIVGPSTTLPVPLTGHSFEDNVFFIITLTVTSNGLEGSSQLNVFPTKSYGSVLAQPNNVGIVVMVDGIPHTPPFTSDQLRGFTNVFEAPSTICFQNRNFNYKSWSDGLPARHNITAPTANYTLTVTYVESGTCVSGPSCFTYKSCGTYVPGWVVWLIWCDVVVCCINIYTYVFIKKLLPK